MTSALLQDPNKVWLLVRAWKWMEVENPWLAIIVMSCLPVLYKDLSRFHSCTFLVDYFLPCLWSDVSSRKQTDDAVRYSNNDAKKVTDKSPIFSSVRFHFADVKQSVWIKFLRSLEGWWLFVWMQCFSLAIVVLLYFIRFPLITDCTITKTMTECNFLNFDTCILLINKYWANLVAVGILTVDTKSSCHTHGLCVYEYCPPTNSF